MGCDIHPCVQVRTPQGWESAGYGPMEEERAGHTLWPILKDRNYFLFAILAGVRNGTGFAGHETSSPVVPISPPRGLPHPLGTIPEDRYMPGERMDFGDHSFSWVTLEELERFPWDEPRVFFGVIPAEDYDAFVKDNKDRSREPRGEWVGWIMGGGIVVLDEREYLVRRKEGQLPSGKVHVKVSWTRPHHAACKRFHGIVLPWLRQLAADNHLRSEDVRLVFGFDS